MAQWVFIAIGTALISGCSSWQLNENTLDVGGSVSDLFKNQVLTNLATLQQDNYALPSLFQISTGTISTTGDVGATFSAPLGNSVTRTVVSNGVSQIVAPYPSVTFPLSDQWSQNWQISPFIKSRQLEVLRAGYLLALETQPATTQQGIAHQAINNVTTELTTCANPAAGKAAAGKDAADTPGTGAPDPSDIEQCQKLAILLKDNETFFNSPNNQFRLATRQECSQLGLQCLGAFYGSMAQRLSRTQQLAVKNPQAVLKLILFTLEVEETVPSQQGQQSKS